jgi:hypothetical protein
MARRKHKALSVKESLEEAAGRIEVLDANDDGRPAPKRKTPRRAASAPVGADVIGDDWQLTRPDVDDLDAYGATAHLDSFARSERWSALEDKLGALAVLLQEGEDVPDSVFMSLGREAAQLQTEVDVFADHARAVAGPGAGGLTHVIGLKSNRHLVDNPNCAVLVRALRRAAKQPREAT